MVEKRQKRRRGMRIKKRTAKRILSNLIMIVAVIVFGISGYQLLHSGSDYVEGRNEYQEVKDLAIEYNDEQEKFRVDFQKLKEINPDIIGWIRFSPEPSIISYPVVQGEDNDEYLRKTFSANENTLGTIFLDVNNSSDLSDRHSIIYGHRMKDGSMFCKLEEYKDKEFWEQNPYFYIYTPWGTEITYHIYSVGVVEDTADTYMKSFAGNEEFQSFIDYTFSTADYETGVKVTTDSQIVTLSTCTASSENHRFVVQGVKIREVHLEE